jgi:hypothetical protein
MQPIDTQIRQSDARRSRSVTTCFVHSGLLAPLILSCGASLSSGNEPGRLTPQQDNAFVWVSSYEYHVGQFESALNFQSQEPATEHLTCQALIALQTIRAKQPLDTLSRFIEWQPSRYALNSSPDPLDGFPVAVAICEIGGEDAWHELCGRSDPSDTDDRRRLLLFAGFRMFGNDKEMLLLRLERWMERERSSNPNATSVRTAHVSQLMRSARDLDFNNPFEWPCYLLRGETPSARVIQQRAR